jgi:RNA polymerase sigma-70 factor, ECF subfamily
VAGGTPLEALAQQQEEARKLINLLSQLPDRERDLIALKYGAGLDNREIARLTGLGEGNIAVILHRTRQQLRKDWENMP